MCKTSAPQMDGIAPSIQKLVVCSLMNIPLSLNLLVIGKPINFVDEYLEVNVGIDLVSPTNDCVQLFEGFHVVVLKRNPLLIGNGIVK